MNTDKNVFPSANYPSLEPGLTKRELIAAMMLQGLSVKLLSTDMDLISQLAIRYADALLKELQK